MDDFVEAYKVDNAKLVKEVCVPVSAVPICACMCLCFAVPVPVSVPASVSVCLFVGVSVWPSLFEHASNKRVDCLSYPTPPTFFCG